MLEDKFPELSQSGYKTTSPESDEYNCIAWAANEDKRFWWPVGKAYWPTGVPRAETLDAFVHAFSTLGYMPCENTYLEQGFEKIALYVNANGKPTHAARQLKNGKWTSKLGRSIDIEHELNGLKSSIYGTVATILKRPTRP